MGGTRVDLRRLLVAWTVTGRPGKPNWEKAPVSHPRRSATAADLPWLLVCPLSELEDNSAMHVDLDGYPLCVTRSLGTVHALLNECSHGQVALSTGDVEDGYVECWLHGSRFDLITGGPTGPPATTPVPVYPTRVSGGSIEVALPASTSGTQGA